METNLILTIILGHWIADFVLQSDYMAINKSKSNLALLVHVVTYSSVMTVIVGVLTELDLRLLWWGGITFTLHFVTDYITSRINAALWQKKLRHWFFVSVGFDQVIHYACLFLAFSRFYQS